MFTFSSPLEFYIGNRAALSAGLGGVRDVASAIISHEQTELNEVCCLDAVFPKDTNPYSVL